MPFTIHPEQKPSDMEHRFLERIAAQEAKNGNALAECWLHAQNARTLKLLR